MGKPGKGWVYHELTKRRGSIPHMIDTLLVVEDLADAAPNVHGGRENHDAPDEAKDVGAGIRPSILNG